MRSSSLLAPLFFAATSFAQAVPEGIAPSSPPPSGCETTANGNFTIGTLKFTHKSTRDTVTVEAANGALFCNLKKGVLRDSYGRTGSVVANHQFQFDGPPQAGAIYTGGFSICKNGSLAIGGTTRWFQCASGEFHNLYDESIGAQCEEIRIQAELVNQPSASAATPVASVVSSLATITGHVSTVSASAVGPTASLSRNSSATAGASSGASGASGASASSTRGGLSPGSSGAAGASSVAPAPPAGGAASASFSIAGSTVLGAVMAFIGGAAFIL